MSKPSNHYTEYAFARPSVEITDNLRDYGQAGMLIRDFFAAAAVTGLLASDTESIQHDQAFANRAYIIADLMMERRKSR